VYAYTALHAVYAIFVFIPYQLVISYIINHLCYLSTTGRHCSCNNVNMKEIETSYSLVQVIATIEWTQLWILCLQFAMKFVSSSSSYIVFVNS